MPSPRTARTAGPAQVTTNAKVTSGTEVLEAVAAAWSEGMREVYRRAVAGGEEWFAKDGKGLRSEPIRRGSTAPSATTAGPTATTAPPRAFPSAGVTYPDGAIVRFGAEDYVFAGGRAFAVPEHGLAGLEKVDHATVVDAASGALPPTSTPPRPGTLIRTGQDGTVYVVGTDGELYGFTAAGQLSSAGFDPTLATTVPGLSGLRVSTRSATAAHVNALSTRADGALVVSGHTCYVFAGGRAFAVPSPAALTAIRQGDHARLLKGNVRAALSAGIANGGRLVGPWARRLRQLRR